MDDTKLISNLDSITKQLQKIAATIGISVGISDKGGKPKIKSTLESSEKLRTRAIAKETAEEYKKILGLGFKKTDAESNVKIFDDKLKISSYFKNTESVFKKMSKSVDSLITVTTNTTAKSISGLTSANQILSNIASKIKNYTSNFVSLEEKFGDAQKTRKDYTPILTKLQTILNSILSNSKRDYTANMKAVEAALNKISSNSPKDYTNSFKELQASLLKVINTDKVDYSPNLKVIQATLSKISTNVPKDYTNSFKDLKLSLLKASSKSPKDYSENLKKISASLSSISTNTRKDYTPYFKKSENLLSTIATNSSKTYIPNLKEIQATLSTIATNTPKDYTTNIQNIEGSLSTIANNAPKDYQPYYQNMQNSLMTIANNVPKDYEPYYQATQSLLTTISTNVPKDYEPIFTEVNSKLESVKRGVLDVLGSVPKGKDLAKGWDLFLRRMKWESFRTIVTDYFVRAEAAATGMNEKLAELIQVNTDILNKKPKSTESGMSLGNIAGLMALGVGLVLIINALVKSNMIDTGNLLKVLTVVGAIVAMFIFVGKVGGGIKNAGIGFGILAATILFLIIPMMMRLTEIDSGTLIEGLLKLAVVFATCLGVLKLMSMIKSSDVMQNTKGFGLFALIVGFLVIPLITHITTIPFEQLMEGLGKLALVFGACLLAMKGAEQIKGGDVPKSMAGVLALSLILKLVVIPMLVDVSSLDWKVLLKGLANVALAIIGMGVVAYAIGQLSKSGGVNMLMGAATILALSFVVGYLGDSLTKVAGKDWSEIYKGLGLATLAIVAFGLVVAGIGALVANPVSALLLGAGAIAIVGLSFVAGYLATSLAKFAGHDWNEITNGVTGSVQAMWTFGKTVAKMGLLVAIAAPFMVAGGAVLMKLAHVSGLLAANLQQFAGRPWNEIVSGLQGSSEAMWSFSKTVAGMGAIVKIFGQSVMDTGSAVLYDLSILAGVLANNLMEFADKPWDSIVGGLESSTVAMAKFGVFVAGVGVFSKLMEMGIDVVYKISDLIGNIAENLFKYSGLDQIDFEQIGKGLIFFGQGLASMFTGSLANVGSSMLDGITGFFKADPVSKIKKFETIDAHKIYELGLGLKYMGEGLKVLTTDLNLTNLIRDITLMAKPVIDLAFGLSQFSDAYKKFQAVQMESDLNQIKNINVQNDSGLKDAITQSSELQLDIMRDQLVELRRNNQLMEMLIANGGNSGSPSFQNAGMMSPMASNKSSESYTSPSFSTKGHYRDNLKLLTMSFQG